MNDTPPSTQAEISLALEALFRDVIRAATSPTSPAEMLVLGWVWDVHLLRDSLNHHETGVDLGAAFMAAVDRLTAHKPQSELIEAQLDLGLMAMRHLVELSERHSMAKSRTASSETDLRAALGWLDKVRGSSTAIAKPAPTTASPVPRPLSVEQELQESDLALEIAVLFREAMRAMSAADSRGAINEMMFSYNACKNLVGRIEHSFYYYSILEQAIEQFQNPQRLTVLETDRLDLARAGLRLLATATDPVISKRGHASRLARDTENFDRSLAYLVQTDDWSGSRFGGSGRE